MGSDLNALSAADAVQAMKSGDITAEAYAGALLERAEAQKDLNAWITLDHDAVMQSAAAADKRRERGEDLGLLHGLPLPIKDSVTTKGIRTTAGTPGLNDFFPTHNATLLDLLFLQGAYVMGKTNLDELSYDFTGDNTHYGAIKNPYDPTRSPGGSSGGSAVAVATRMAPLAIAEDTLGSIRIPASMCGLTGLRASYGRYPDHGVLPLTQHQFDQLGALTNCVSDLVLFDAAVRGGETPTIAATPLKGVRIGISPVYFDTLLDDSIAKVWKNARKRLEDAGAELVEAEIPPFATMAQPAAFNIIGYGTEPSMSEFLLEQQTGLSFQELYDRATPKLREEMNAHAVGKGRPSPAAYSDSLLQRTLLQRSMREYYSDNNLDLLAFVPNLIPPPPLGKEDPVKLDGRVYPFYVAMAHNVALASCGGQPGLVLPAGFTDSGLPVGVEFDGPVGSDRKLMSIGLSLEKALGAMKAPPPPQ